jgi:hypothetical protein
MATEIRPVANSPMDGEPNAVGTPEGDNEFAPDQPLKPLPDGAEQTPRGNEPDPYKGE